MATTNTKKTETKETTKKAPAKKPATTAKAASTKTATKKPVTKKPATKKAPVKKTKKETTVVMTIEATFILKAGQTPDSIDVANICPAADNVNLKKMQVFEKDE